MFLSHFPSKPSYCGFTVSAELMFVCCYVFIGHLELSASKLCKVFLGESSFLGRNSACGVEAKTGSVVHTRKFQIPISTLLEVCTCRSLAVLRESVFHVCAKFEWSDHYQTFLLQCRKYFSKS